MEFFGIYFFIVTFLELVWSTITLAWAIICCLYQTIAMIVTWVLVVYEAICWVIRFCWHKYQSMKRSKSVTLKGALLYESAV